MKTERGNSKYIPTNTAGIDSYNIHSECCIMLHTQNLIYNFFKSRQVLHKDFERGLKSRFIHPKSKNIQRSIIIISWGREERKKAEELAEYCYRLERSDQSSIHAFIPLQIQFTIGE